MMPVKKRAPTDIDGYLSRVAEPTRSRLGEIRAAVHKLFPDAVEVISYQIPAFRYKGRMLVWFAGFSSHCSLFPGASVIKALAGELKNFQTSKGTIQFPLDKPVPAALVRKLLKARAAEIGRQEG